MRKKWQPTRSHRRWQRSAPHLPRDGLGNDEKSSEPSWTRIAGQTLFSGQPRRSRMPLNQTHNPSVAGSSPARPTTVSPGQGLCAKVDDLARSAPSPQRIRRSSRPQSVERRGQRVQFGWEQMRVAVECQRRSTVPQLLLDDLDARA
jgi:hypothetical protein